MEKIRPNETEITPRNEEIFHCFESRVVSPEKPLVKANEGTHLRVIPDQKTPPYFETASKIKDTIKPFLASLAAARAIFGDRSDPNEYRYWSQWVNIHTMPRFGGNDQFQVEVIGRNARSEETWAKPIVYPEGEDYPQKTIVLEEREMLERTIPKYAQEIAQEAGSVKLFDEENASYEPQEKTLVSFQNFHIMMAKRNPHVEEGGLHLWVHANGREQHEGVQSDVKNAVEEYIISQAVAKAIYEKLGRKVEIHFSGNWGLPTHHQQEEKVAKGGDPNVNYYQENLFAHANLYVAPPNKELVTLPERPVYTRPEIPEEVRQEVKKILEENLTQYLDEFIGKTIQEVI